MEPYICNSNSAPSVLETIVLAPLEQHTMVPLVCILYLVSPTKLFSNCPKQAYNRDQSHIAQALLCGCSAQLIYTVSAWVEMFQKNEFHHLGI